MRSHFRFEDLEIWQLAKVLAAKFHKLASFASKVGQRELGLGENEDEFVFSAVGTEYL